MLARVVPAPATARVTNTHPSEEALAALLEDGVDDTADRAGTASTRQHVASCPVCTCHLAELRALRHVLQGESAREAPPPRDLTRAALERLRRRQSTVGRLNDLLTVVVGFVCGLAILLVDPGPARGSTVPTVPASRQNPPDASEAAGAAGTAGGEGG